MTTEPRYPSGTFCEVCGGLAHVPGETCSGELGKDALVDGLARMAGKRPLPKIGLRATTGLVRPQHACQLFVE